VLLQSKSLAQGPKEIYKTASKCNLVDCFTIDEYCHFIRFLANLNGNCCLIIVFIFLSQILTEIPSKKLSNA